MRIKHGITLGLICLVIFASLSVCAVAQQQKLQSTLETRDPLIKTARRDLPATRLVADIQVDDFFDNMESGFLANLVKTGPGAFTFDIQDNRIYGYQGTLMVWFYGMCDLRNVKVVKGESLRMAVRLPNGLAKVRPVYSFDNISWRLVPEGWGVDKELFRFEIPLEQDQTRVYFATHYPYPSTRVLERALTQAKSKYVKSIEMLGRSERERPITLLSVTDLSTPDKGKRAILLSAGDHAGETASVWGLEGSIDFLLSESPVARTLRRNNIFYIVPILSVDGFALGTDRRQATGVNIYFDYQNFESREARLMWNLVSRIRPVLWLDYHSWHLGVAEGLYGPHPKIVGDEKFASVAPLMKAIGKHFPINQQGPDTLDSPNTQALLKLGIPGFCPEFNFGVGSDGRWKSTEDQRALGARIMLGVADYLTEKR